MARHELWAVCAAAAGLAGGAARADDPLAWLRAGPPADDGAAAVLLPQPPVRVTFADLPDRPPEPEVPGAEGVVSDPLAAEGLRPEGRTHRAAAAEYDLFGLRVSSRTSVPDPTAAPDTPRPVPRTWSQSQSTRVPVYGPLRAFGQVGASSSSVEDNRLAMSGKTGVELVFAPWKTGEVQVRSGPVLKLADPGAPVPVEDQTRMAVELTASTELFGPVRLEYSGTALPALTPLEKEWVSQDLKFTVKLSEDSNFHLGTRYSWEGPVTVNPFAERSLYMGVTLKR